jgi:arabinogalactan oligomer/maltooligosaccharide transport system permease protein
VSQATLEIPEAQTVKKSWWKRLVPTLRAWIYILPAGLLMFVITFFPQAYQGWMAFTDYRIKNLRFNIFDSATWETFGPPFVGIENFIRVLTSDLAIENYDFVRLLWFNASWTVSNVFFHVVLGVIIALVLKSKDLKGRGFYRAIFVLPWAIPGLIIAFTWRNMFDRRFGAINQMIELLNQWFGLSLNSDIRWLEASEAPLYGIPGLTLALIVLAPLVIYGLLSLFQSSRSVWFKLLITALIAYVTYGMVDTIMGAPLSYWAVLIANIWLGWPFMTVIATGALQSIPEEMYEASRIDGASGWQQIWNITLPMIRPAMVPAIMVGTIWTFNNFNVIFFISQGGPFGRTELLVTQAYKLVFTQRVYGIAAAFSIVVFFVLLFITLAQNRVTRATEAYYE